MVFRETSVLITGILANAIAGRSLNEYFDQALAAIDSLEGFLTGYSDFTERICRFFGSPSFICLIGRGDSLSTVQAGALFIQEVVKYPAISFDGGEFRHGPFEMVQEGFSAMVVAPKGRTSGLNLRLTHDIVRKGGKVLLITNEKVSERDENVFVADFQGGMDESMSPIVTVAPIQLLADGMAREKGIEAGKFRWGGKVMAAE